MPAMLLEFENSELSLNPEFFFIYSMNLHSKSFF